ncbi:hypothetical protein [Microbacterium paludicola]|uniref:hypothetical protein n=1 Tax=Microbacterium paludicola TaxID=300019 RepID=UPI0011A9B595|nr:hypothetical protein [Microbacterium paludicola]
MGAKLHTTVDERLTDPDSRHPRLRRQIREWAEARVFWRRGKPSYPTREARVVRPVPSSAIRAMKEAA